jgi:hypothetical protein
MAEQSNSITEEHIDLDFDLGLVAFEEKKAIPIPMKHTLIWNYKDLIDLSTTTTTRNDNNPPAVEDEKLELETQSSIIEEVEILKQHSKHEQKQTASEAHVPDAELGVASLTEAMLIQAPIMTSVLQSNKVGDGVLVKVSANGMTCEVTWKVTGTYKPVKPSSTSTSLPIANPTPTFFTFTTRCKFGCACIKGTSCPYSHTKFCIWVTAP